MTQTASPTRIALIAGAVRKDDRRGHHDYLASCSLMADLLCRLPGIKPIVIDQGWPLDDHILMGCAAVVIYDGGNGKQGFLQSPQRVACLQQLIDMGAGLTVIHKAIAFPGSMDAKSIAWLGGSYVPGVSDRGHWSAEHKDFSQHPIVSGLEPWHSSDGWLNNIQFGTARQNITALLWSGQHDNGSAEGGDKDIVSWVYDRPDGGRSFCFTGLDAHSAWHSPNLCRFILNGILWSARQEIPTSKSWCGIDKMTIDSHLSPRSPSTLALLKRLWRVMARRVKGRDHKW